MRDRARPRESLPGRSAAGPVGRPFCGSTLLFEPRFDVPDQVALVTGAARGLGRAIALALAAAGADVALGLRDCEADGGVAAQIEALGRRAMLFT